MQMSIKVPLVHVHLALVLMLMLFSNPSICVALSNEQPEKQHGQVFAALENVWNCRDVAWTLSNHLPHHRLARCGDFF